MEVQFDSIGGADVVTAEKEIETWIAKVADEK